MAGLLADPRFVAEGQKGLFYGGGKQLGYQIMAVVAYGVWSAGCSIIMFGTLNYFGMFRVEKEVEIMGLDAHHHGGYSYRIKGHLEDDETMTGVGSTKHGNDSASDEGDVPSSVPVTKEVPFAAGEVAC